MKRNLKINETIGAPVDILSLGLGVQSSTILLLAEKGIIQPPAVAVFADTGSETKQTYEWLNFLRSFIRKTPIQTISVGNLETAIRTTRRSKSGREYTRRLLPVFTHNADGSIGRIQTRGCTVEHKVKPLQKFQRTFAGVRYGQTWPGVRSWIGISTDEATRMRDSYEPWILNHYPLIDLGMSRSDCLEFWGDNRLPLPPRSSCRFCPFHTKAEWLKLKREQPDEWQQAIDLERSVQEQFRVIHPNFQAVPALTKWAKSLDSLTFDDDDGTDGRTGLAGECTGLCGV